VKLLTKVKHTHSIHWVGNLGWVSVDDVLGWVGKFVGWTGLSGNKWTHVHLCLTLLRPTYSLSPS